MSDCKRRQVGVSELEQIGNILQGVSVEMPSYIPDTLEELRALDRRIEREWWWLNGAMHATAQVRADRSSSDPHAFREMQAQAREVDRLSVQIAMRIAAIEASTCQRADPAISRQS